MHVLSLIVFYLLLCGVSSCAGSVAPWPAGLPQPAPPVLPADVPPPLPLAPSPQSGPGEDTYTIAVNNAPVRQLLNALARDAGRNFDIDPAVRGRVSINAQSQTLEDILERIATQVPLRYIRHAGGVQVLPDSVYMQSYRVDYVNMRRSSSGSISVATQIASGAAAQKGAVGNRSRTELESEAQAGFWEALQHNIAAIVSDGGDASRATGVSINAVAGLVTVHARYQQHRRIAALLGEMQQRAGRQVLIEASIVEVELADRYQSGVDWERLLRTDAGRSLGLRSATMGGVMGTAPYFLLNYSGGGFEAAIRLLQTFGKVKVLSNPKIMALNNQTALLKVVDEKVYFTVDREESRNSDGVLTGVNYSSAVHTVPVGLVLSVTPQITDASIVSMIIRPSISRITGYATDPAPRLAEAAPYDNLIPEIQVREMESMLAVASGRTVMLGGLMQNRHRRERSGVPGLSGLPLLGRLFSYQNDSVQKTELIIMLRPRVISSAGGAPGRGFDERL